ncbi:MAG: tRNA 2-thiouridine(34) synthase MnmA [Candidatus Taylorbacteria bacterium]|nr:tRNA 2-thiouridine(34) synthase MnmA [Candidatus Taylorbacteria bacterium]
MKKVYVAMSGGVDSSVAAALLKEKGHDVTGVFFKPWQPEAGLAFCNWQKDRQDAMAVTEVLGIPFKTWDFSKEYKNKVGDYMIEAYRKGTTPNPDVMCNKEIKFGLFLKKALKERVDFIATGHYVRVAKKNKSYLLKQAKDKNKDQSYFLWTLTQKELERTLFPVGNYTKPEVRKLAKKFGLPTFDKKDSQGVCFIGQLDMKEFLKKYIDSKQGNIILSETGQVIGEHDGAAYYTTGQRHGLNISNGGGPYYVSDKDLKKNLVFVTKDEKKLGRKEIAVIDINWIGPIKKTGIKIKARYSTLSMPAEISIKGSSIKIKTIKPIRAVTPGQSVVFYRGQEMLGGGIIT